MFVIYKVRRDGETKVQILYCLIKLMLNKNIHIMKNIKLGVESHLEFDYYSDFHLIEEIDAYENYPKRQGMKKLIQRGNNMRVDMIKKDGYRANDDKSPYYYARLLLNGSVGKTIDECLTKFKKKFTDPHALRAFWHYFEEDNLYKFSFKNSKNIIEDGIVKKITNRKRKSYLFDNSNYKELYWDDTNLRYTTESEYKRYIEAKEEYEDYLKSLRKYNKRIKDGQTRDRWGYPLRKPKFCNRDLYILNYKYPLGIKKIVTGESIEIPRKSNFSKRYYAEKAKERSTYYDWRRKPNPHLDSFLKIHNKEVSKVKREIKENKTQGNFSLVFSMDFLKYLQKTDEIWKY